MFEGKCTAITRPPDDEDVYHQIEIDVNFFVVVKAAYQICNLQDVVKVSDRNPVAWVGDVGHFHKWAKFIELKDPDE